jgi:hypothetical protein
MKTILLITILAISTYAQSYILYRISPEGREKIALFKDQGKVNWYNCYYVKDLIEKDEALDAKQRTYECVVKVIGE